MLFAHAERALLNQAQARALPLGTLTRSGDAAAALARLDGCSIAEVVDLMMRAGFSIVVPPRVDFMSYMRSQLREACRLRVDGFGLRELKLQRLR